MGKREMTLREVVSQHLLFEVWCGCCRKKAYFVAADLITLRNYVRPISELRFVCSRCKTALWINFNTYLPRPDDLGRLVIKRKVNGAWRDEPLKGRVVRD